MNHEWVVMVKDAKGPVTDAEVCLVKRKLAELTDELPYPAVAATHPHAGAGKHLAKSPITPADGDWLLIVRRPSSSPVVQPLRLARRGATFVTTAPLRASTVDLKSKTVTADADAVHRVTFTVTLDPPAEVVFISGTDTRDKLIAFDPFANARRDAVRQAKLLGNGGLATLFSCDHRVRRTFVAAQTGWLLIHEHRFAPDKGMREGTKRIFEEGNDISATEVYKYLSSQVAVRAPKSVKEVSWFGHGYGGGPVLWDTMDSSWTGPRSKYDYDARPKDFSPDVVPFDWPNLKQALAADCTWHTWGCRADTHDRRMIVTALAEKKRPGGELFVVESDEKVMGKWPQKIVETLSGDWVRWYVDNAHREHSYCAAAASFLGIPCFGAPVGTGSDIFTVGAALVQMIDTRMYAAVLQYMREQFGPEFKATDTTYDRGFVDYGPLLKRKVLAKPSLGPGRYKFTTVREVTWSLEWDNDKRQDGGFPNRLEVQPRKAFGARKLDGFLYIVHNTSDAKFSLAFFASSEPGVVVYRVTRGSKGDFDTLGAALT